MLGYCDCIGICGLDENEVEVLASGAHVNLMSACAIAETLTETPDGCQKVLAYMVRGLEQAEVVHDHRQVERAHQAIYRFVEHHALI
ncbi:MAG: hypothetical protein KDI15_00905 [Thiothrix sp.]|nr:hypothetical protein [Thiothrix sp.]HPE61211.1 hypothetical protein [Thiolinea sp.]